MLNKAIRNRKNEAEAQNGEEPKEIKLGDYNISCCMKWPICLYDFTIRSRLSNFFVFKVAKPVRIIQDYFQTEYEELDYREEFEMNYVLIPFANK